MGIDYCSCFQNPRVGDQDAQFREALGTMNWIYGHAWVECIIMNTVPKGVIPYSKRAWPFFERLVSCGKLNSFDKIFAIGDDFDIDAWEKKPSKQKTFMELAKGQILPPMLPDLFDYEVAKMNITSGGDMALIQKTYKKNFACFISAPVMNFAYAETWTEKETEQLTLLLPLFTKMKHLIMHKTGVGDEAIHVMAPNILSMKEWPEPGQIENW